MPSRFSRVALVMLLLTHGAISLSGCARLAKNRQCQPMNECVVLVSRPKTALTAISFDDRTAIVLSDQTHPIEGFPLAGPVMETKLVPSPPTEVRDLTLPELQRLAQQSAPVAQKLESHRDWLATLGRTPPSILEALTHQARYERSKHTQMATQAYLSLAKVYTKSPILKRSDEILVEAEGAVEKFREAGIEIPGDPQELGRRRMEVTEQFVEVRYNQVQLNDALESLLNLTQVSSQPIWTNYQAQVHGPLPTEESALSQAMAQRGDLLALERLACDSQSLSVDFLRGADAGSPWLGVGFELPGPAKWWQCQLQDKIECLKQSAQSERQRQLQMLVENKRDQIRLEIRQSLHSLEQLESRLKLKLERLGALRQSLAAAEKAKDLRPVDFKERLQQRIDELNLIAEIVDELIGIEIERDQLNHHLGL